MKARLHRLEQRSRPDPAPVRFIIRTGEDDEGWTVRRFTIRLDRPNVDQEPADA